MDHDEVREELELAATEPQGIDRLMAGDTPTAQAVAGHLAGCPACAEELVRLRRTASLIGDVVRAIPPPELRDRTLAYVREYGRVHEPAGVDAPAPLPVDASTPLPVDLPRNEEPTGGRRTAPLSRLGWIAAAAAVAVFSVATTAVLLQGSFSERLDEREATAQNLARITVAAVALGSEADATRVELADATGSSGTPLIGTLLFSPTNAEVVVIASGLVEPQSDLEYRCWVEVDGVRSGVGKMFFGGGLAYWAGRVDAVEGLPAGATFGVSLVDAAGGSVEPEPVLEGRVGG
jgi:hypothetical protein